MRKWLAVFLLIAAFSGVANATIVVTQAGDVQQITTSNTGTTTMATGNISAGATVIGVAMVDTGNTLSAASCGESLTKVIGYSPGNDEASIWVLKNSPGGCNTITWVFDASVSESHVSGYELAGATGDWEATASNQETSTSHASGSITPAADGAFVVSASACTGLTSGGTPGSGYTEQVDARRDYSQYIIQGTAAATNSPWTSVSSRTCYNASASFPAAGGGLPIVIQQHYK